MAELNSMRSPGLGAVPFACTVTMHVRFRGALMMAGDEADELRRRGWTERRCLDSLEGRERGKVGIDLSCIRNLPVREDERYGRRECDERSGKKT